MSDKKEKFKLRSLIPGFIQHDFIRKVIALFFAIFIWQRVDDEITQPDTLRDVDVNIVLPHNLVRLDDNSIKIDVSLKASRRILSKLTKDDIKLQINIDPGKLKRHPMLISHRIDKITDIKVPSGITVTGVKPDVVSFTVDRKMTRTLPVKLEYSGYLLEEYSYRVSNIIPKSVIVIGPESIVGEMKFIKSRPIILKPENVEDFEVDTSLVSKKNVSLSRKIVTVQIEIYRKYDTRDFADIQIKPLGFPLSPAKIKFSPSSVTATIFGIRKSIEILKPEEIHPFVDISGLKVPGIYNLKVKYWVDVKDVTIRGGAPDTIKVELSKP